MRRIDSLALLGLSTAVLGGPAGVLADSPNNPYKVIYERNAFDLRPPTPPPTNAPPVAASKVNINFTGISKIGKIKRAYMVTADSKNPGKYLYYDLGENEKSDGIEVLEINEADESVKIRNSGEEILMTFQTHGLKGPVVANVPAGTPPPPGGGRSGVPAPGAPSAATHPGKIASAGSGPIIVGSNGNPTDQANGDSSKRYSYTPGGANTANPASTTTSASAGRTSDGTALRTIPTRSLRTQPSIQQQPAQQNQSVEEQVLMMKAQEMEAARRNISLPPIPPVPGLPPMSE